MAWGVPGHYGEGAETEFGGRNLHTACLHMAWL